jgi:hypothetical protein
MREEERSEGAKASWSRAGELQGQGVVCEDKSEWLFVFAEAEHM